MTGPSQIQRELAVEASKLSKVHRGRHVFENIPPADAGAANWTAGFHCIASACPMDEMREALARVQAKYSTVAFK